MKSLETPGWKKRKKRKRKKKMWLIGFLLFSLFSFSAGSAYVFKATIVNSFFARVGDTHLPAPAIDGNKIRVREGESFQSALNRAKPGDTIFLQAKHIHSNTYTYIHTYTHIHKHTYTLIHTYMHS